MRYSDKVLGFVLGRYEYDKRTGNVLNAKTGKPVGSVNDRGYLVTSIAVPGLPTKLYKVHQLAWVLIYGEWPTEGMFVDHIDRDPANNRRKNLRLVTKRLNNRNRATHGTFCPYTVITWKKPFRKWAVFIPEGLPDVFTKKGYHGMYDTDVEAMAIVDSLLKV